MKRAIVFDFLLPIILLMLLTIVFWVTDLDLVIAGKFFVLGKGWVYKDANPWRWMYDVAPLPAIFLTVAALLALIGSFRIRKFVPYRKTCVFIVLLMLIGPGLIVNGGFKKHWDRPRPRSIAEFGGHLHFHYVWEKGKDGEGSSFPSGHASMGFFLMAPFFFLRTSSKKWARGFLLLGLSAGLIVGIGRIVQGGHYASDVIWAGGFIYLCGAGLSYLLRLERTTFSLSSLQEL